MDKKENKKIRRGFNGFRVYFLCHTIEIFVVLYIVSIFENFYTRINNKNQ